MPVVVVNKHAYQVKGNKLSGKQILELAGLDTKEYDLYQISGQQTKKITPEKSITLKLANHFNAILKNAYYGAI